VVDARDDQPEHDLRVTPRSGKGGGVQAAPTTSGQHADGTTAGETAAAASPAADPAVSRARARTNTSNKIKTRRLSLPRSVGVQHSSGRSAGENAASARLATAAQASLGVNICSSRPVQPVAAPILGSTGDSAARRTTRGPTQTGARLPGGRDRRVQRACTVV